MADMLRNQIALKQLRQYPKGKISESYDGMNQYAWNTSFVKQCGSPGAGFIGDPIVKYGL
jgi:hypothetical protein